MKSYSELTNGLLESLMMPRKVRPHCPYPAAIGNLTSLQNKTPETSQLNRESQRRSRARHREYVEGLERRLREYERQGAQATLDMQLAARAVSVENQALREMLSSFGLSENDIDARLRSAATTSLPSSGCRASVTKLRTEAQPLAPPTAMAAGDQKPPCSSSSNETTYADNSGACRAGPYREPNLEKPCAEAAIILAQLRGYTDTAAIRAALGCSEEGDCYVRNTKLLQIMDEVS